MSDFDGARNESFLRRVLPNTALSLAALVFFMGIASAFTGAVLYAYYEARQQRTENEVEAFVADFADEVEAARGVVRAEGETALGQIQAQLDELEQFAASGQTLQSLVDRVAPSVWFVSTQDEAGAPSAGSAFVVFADTDQSFLLASYTTVRAATVDPGPSVIVSKAGEEYEATLFSWDPALDLALLAIPKPSLPALPWAGDDPAVRLGDRVLVVSGFGGDGAAVTQGFVAAVSAEGIQHDAPVGAAYQGGPLVNTNGEVVAVASRAYSPAGFDPLAVFLAPPVRRACDSVVQCPSGAPGQPAG
ncbi:MAG: trypsin-like peptidase domain-containing protein [Acidimicrobiales bacterium]